MMSGWVVLGKVGKKRGVNVVRDKEKEIDRVSELVKVRE